MSAYSFALICLRVLSVYFFFNIIVQLPMMQVGFNELLGFTQDQTLDYRLMLLQGTVSSVLTLIIAGSLWWLAPFIARKILNIKSEHKHIALIKLNTITLQATAISTVGFLLLVLALPQLMAALIGLYKFPNPEFFSASQNPYFNQVLVRSLQILFSLLLILGVKFWVQLLNKLKLFGLNKKASNV